MGWELPRSCWQGQARAKRFVGRRKTRGGRSTGEEDAPPPAFGSIPEAAGDLEFPHLDPHPVNKNGDLCEQSDMEIIGMCVHASTRWGGRWQSPYPVCPARATTMIMTMVVVTAVVTIYQILTRSYILPSALSALI